MLSFFNNWGYRWKCEFDTDVKIEKYNDHDGEQLLFYEKAHIKTQSKTGCSCNLYIIAYIVARNPNLFDKKCTQGKPQESFKYHISTWRKLTWMKR